MKKLITIIVLALGITITTQAQKKGSNKDQLTVAQRTELKVKKMTLKLDLTDTQINQITPLVKKQIEQRSKMREQHKATKDADSKMTSDERFAKANKRLDNQIALKKSMKQILNEEQFKKYEKMGNRKNGKHKKKGKKGQKEGECDKASCKHDDKK